ncbi:hypothetical protein NMY22_g3372 [Coprinellus aureogranulatus]|nr:hypothetical protein NMY22_g3372 [Coprinellus aureogranulatus]
MYPIHVAAFQEDSVGSMFRRALRKDLRRSVEIQILFQIVVGIRILGEAVLASIEYREGRYVDISDIAEAFEKSLVREEKKNQLCRTPGAA